MAPRKRSARRKARGADLVIVAASAPGIVEQAMACSRPGVAHPAFCPDFGYTERIEASGADLCVVNGCFRVL